jgi:hypothetical protein
MASKRTDKPRSNGSKQVTCVRCTAPIQPYAGRAISLYGNKFLHHPGQCADAAELQAMVRSTAQQGELFAWSCQHLDVGNSDDTAEICGVASTDRAEFAAHMKLHGRTAIKSEPKIRLRKPVPAAKLPAPNVAKPFKTLTWTRRTYSEWQPGIGQACTERPMRGQFWSNGQHPHSVVAITYTEHGSGIKPELVTLYVHGDGSVSEDWSAAKNSRRDTNRYARRTAA